VAELTRNLLKITPDQLKRLLDELPEPDGVAPDSVEPTDVPEGVLDHLPTIETAVMKHLYGDAAAMSDAEFEQFLTACGLDKLLH
jgi:hypothetical protein